MLDIETQQHPGIEFALTEEQRAIHEAARDFARREVDPIVEEIDEAQRFPREVMAKAGELGFLGIIFPEEYGGAGMGYVEYVLVVTELSKVDPSVASASPPTTRCARNHIFKFGNEEQRRRWLVPLAAARRSAPGASPSPTPGPTPPAPSRGAQGRRRLGARRRQDLHHPRLGGRHLRRVRGDRPEGARKGRNISAFVLEKGIQGFRAGKKENKLGIRASDTAEVVMENCFVPDENLLGEPREGFKQAMQILDGGRISIAALGLGTAIGAFETALAYAKERQQFGKPIAEFQAIQFALAEMATRIAAAEALTFAAADGMDRGGRSAAWPSEAKLYTGETAVFCSERGVQIHGGYGFVKDYRAEKYYRDAKICTIGEGTSEIQRLVIARTLRAGVGRGRHDPRDRSRRHRRAPPSRRRAGSTRRSASPSRRSRRCRRRGCGWR